MFGRIHPWSCLVLDFFCGGGECFYCWFNLIKSVHIFYFFQISLGRFYIFRNLCISSRLFSPQQFLMIRCTSVVLVLIFKIFLPLFFSLMNLAKDLSILFFFSKKQALVSLIFFCGFFFGLYFIYFCSDLYCFPSTTFGFYLFFFSVSLGIRLDHLRFLVSWGRLIITS